MISVSKSLLSHPGATSTFWSPSHQEQWARSPSHSLVHCFVRDSPWMLRNLASRNCRPQPATVFHVVPRRTIVWSPGISEAHCLAGYLWKQCSQRTVQDEEALAEPDLAPTLPVRASDEKTRVNIAKASSKVEEGQFHAVLLWVKMRSPTILQLNKYNSVEFCWARFTKLVFVFFLFLVSVCSFVMAKT